MKTIKKQQISPDLLLFQFLVVFQTYGWWLWRGRAAPSPQPPTIDLEQNPIFQLD